MCDGQSCVSLLAEVGVAGWRLMVDDSLTHGSDNSLTQYLGGDGKRQQMKDFGI